MIPATDHAWGAWTKVDDTNHQRICGNDANHVQTEAHDWQQTDSTDATCTAKGTVSYECTVCHAAKTETGDFGGHTLTFVPAAAGVDCEHYGVIAHYICGVCGKTFTDETAAVEITDVSDHVYGAHTPGETAQENVVPATCTTPGSAKNVTRCAVCSEVIASEDVTLPIDENAHVWNEWTTDVPATCTADGTEIRTCAEDASHTETRTVKAFGHDWSEWVTVIEVTPEEDGLLRRTCNICGETEEQTVKFNGEKDRKVQFVVSGNMSYVVYMDDIEYHIYNKSTPALYWYKEKSLTFDVVTYSTWGADGIVVSLNGKELAPNANGSYTIPAGTDYAKINCYPAAATVTQGESHGDTCPFCGKVHPSNIWGRIVAFVHVIFAFFQKLFHR